MVKRLFVGFAALFAKNRYITFVITLFPFCFAAGLLAYTENNKLVTNASGVVAGFSETHTSWREAMTLIVIVSSLLSWLGLIFKSQNLVAVCGVLMKWCAVAMFVVASFDMDTAKMYCVDNPDNCNPEKMAASGINPNQMMNNLYIAPWLDYICFIIFFCAGAVLRQHAIMLQEAANQAEGATVEGAAPYSGA